MLLEVKRFIIVVFPYVLSSTLASLIIWGEDLKKILPRLLAFTLLSSFTQTATYQIHYESLRFPLEVASGFLVAILVFRKPVKWILKIYVTSYILGILSGLCVAVLVSTIFSVPGSFDNVSIMWSVVIIPIDLLMVSICLLIRKFQHPVLGFLYELKAEMLTKWPIFLAFFLQLVLFTGLIAEIHIRYLNDASPFLGAVLAPISILLLYLSVFIIVKYLKASRKETIISTQNAISDNIQEMITLLRGQQHDFLNQLQVISALSQSGKLTALQEYVNKLLKDVISYNEILKLSNPALSALVNVKITQANSRGIKIKTNVHSAFSDIEEHTLDIARILGNLLDNALEAVEKTEIEKTISLEVYEKGPMIIMEVKNPLSKGILDLEKIYQPGFSTKGGSHSGMGLYNCRQIAKKICAELICVHEPQNEITFSLVLPKM